MDLEYIYFLYSLIWPWNQSDEATRSERSKMTCASEMAGKPTRERSENNAYWRWLGSQLNLSKR
ncbi:unnamed protein product [Schistosoma mansoni]|uniref:Smp_201280 n=1 Tax=Schistosoma mansoni TaxID=6183 RepID=UPI00022C8632|nr:unnamed protein product [Schistosoma mansoni]|eukprot:XP_018645104.1 unnamed protein product [Schistosoma mansoni]